MRWNQAIQQDCFKFRLKRLTKVVSLVDDICLAAGHVKFVPAVVSACGTHVYLRGSPELLNQLHSEVRHRSLRCLICIGCGWASGQAGVRHTARQPDSRETKKGGQRVDGARVCVDALAASACSRRARSYDMRIAPGCLATPLFQTAMASGIRLWDELAGPGFGYMFATKSAGSTEEGPDVDDPWCYFEWRIGKRFMCNAVCTLLRMRMCGVPHSRATPVRRRAAVARQRRCLFGHRGVHAYKVLTRTHGWFALPRHCDQGAATR